jgi:hypothetical protein
MDNTTSLYILGAIVIVAAIYFSKKKDSTPTESAPVEPAPVEPSPAETAPVEVEATKKPSRKGGKSKVEATTEER